VNDLPITHKGLARHNIQNAMAAMAAAEQLGLALNDITTAARGFESSPECNYGRLNFIGGLPFTLIVDYAHNKMGYETFCAFLQGLGISGRKICAFGLHGVRMSDATAIETVEALAPHFDVFAPFTRSDKLHRRAGFSEVMGQGLIKAGVKRESISPYEDESEAIEFALRSASKGDLVVILGRVNEDTLKTHIALHRSRSV
jgi:cyanophycin synthetase